MSKENSGESKLIKRWVTDNIVDDIEDNIKIAQLAIRKLNDNFSVGFGSPETVLAFYGVVYDSIIEVLKEKREKKSSYNINIAGRFEIGYTDSEENEDQEKMGSFVPYVFDLNSNKVTNKNVEDKKSLEACIEWSSQNLKENPEVIKEISTKALTNLKDRIDLHLGHYEIIIPLFVNIHECMISYLKLKQAEADEYETYINFASCFDVFVRRNEEKEQNIEYCPTITMKLETKSDAVATAKHE